MTEAVLYSSDVDCWLECTKQCQYLPEDDFKMLCLSVMDILVCEPNILHVSTPVTVCGDVHGQYYDVEELFRTGGLPPATKYVFMGDFVDRGYYSLETITKLLVLKMKYPDSIYLIRGNHETRQITQTYGFYDECVLKYGNANPWRLCCQLFDLIAVAAIIDDTIFCVHGGLSPNLKTLEKIQVINRNIEVPSIGGFCDLLWSDPEDIYSWEISPRGAGWLFGENVTEEFLHRNGLALICRAHQLVQEGYKYMFNERLVTVWSAPNYCYRCGNVASIIDFRSAEERVEKVFVAVDGKNRSVPEPLSIPYFL